MSDPGHVFVVHGDLTRLACDAYLVPTDASGHVTAHWDKFGLSAHLGAGARVTDPIEHANGGYVRWVDTGGVSGLTSIDWLRIGVQQGLEAAAGDLTERPARYGRQRPLIGMPAFGTGAGGFAGGNRGEALDAVLAVAGDVVERTGFDVVIVCRNRADYAAVQSRQVRRSMSAAVLDDTQLQAAESLAEHAARGNLALFLGAGVSIPAGLPDWTTLLAKLAEAAGEADVDGDDPLKAASLLQSRLGLRFDEVLERELSRAEYAVGHALAASLRVDEVITTNFDSLYEQAAEVTFEPRRLQVLPWDRAQPGQPWVLKMHGAIGRGHVVITREDYDSYDERWRPLASMVQALLMTKHVLFVGYSMTDQNFVRLARDVSRLLSCSVRSTAPSAVPVGTVLTLNLDDELQQQWRDDLDIVPADSDGGDVVRAARRLEILLDRIAVLTAGRERSYLLDSRYAELVGAADRHVAERVAELARHLSGASKNWGPLIDLLCAYGADIPAAVHREMP